LQVNIKLAGVLVEAPAPIEAKPVAEATKAAAAEPARLQYHFMKAVRCLCLGGCPNADSVIISSKHATELLMYHNWKDLTRVLIDSLKNKVKILGDGELTKKLQVTAHKFSKTAEQKIVASGGTAKVI
jgi:hypothetical protein